MLIALTNTCRMGCPHCLQCATPDPQHMSWEHIERSRDFDRWAGAQVVLLSGGELTEHPKWTHAVDLFASSGFLRVILPTNGMWIGTSKEDEMFALLRTHQNIRLQVTSVPGLYPLHKQTLEGVSRFKLRLRDAGLKRRLSFETKIESMIELGRACDHEPSRKAAQEDPRKTMSCLSSAVVSAQVMFKDAIKVMEPRGVVCHPLIDWQGNLHWSESWLCPSFASIDEEFEEIGRKAHEWRPCGKCAGFRKFIESTDEKYALGKIILGFDKNGIDTRYLTTPEARETCAKIMKGVA